MMMRIDAEDDQDESEAKAKAKDADADNVSNGQRPPQSRAHCVGQQYQCLNLGLALGHTQWKLQNCSRCAASVTLRYMGVDQ